MKMILPA